MTPAQFHRISKALADPRRYQLLRRIARKPEVVCNDIRREFPVSPATLSHHVKELTNAGLIEVRKDAKVLCMKLCRKVWNDYLAQLRKL